jgi:hypothetical protein
MNRTPQAITAVFLLLVLSQVVFGEPRIEAAFGAGIVVGLRTR